jgi:hypothetical protein
MLNLDEAFHETRGRNWFDKHYKPFSVIKVMPDQISHPAFNKLMDTAYVISLRRKDVVAQFTSFYICHMSQKWHYLKNDIDDKEIDVEIHQEELENQIRYLQKNQIIHQRLIQNHSQYDFFYEDIVDLLQNNTAYMMMPKPPNYDVIYQCINDWIQDPRNIN